MPDRHPPQIQYPVGGGRGNGRARGQRDPLRPDRPPAGTPQPAPGMNRGSGRNNPFQDPVREVRVKLDTGKVLRILSNDLDAPAREIADLYKRRWAIELFFRWVKQTLKIRRFFGISENAVRIQIAVALIAFLLLRLAQAGQRAVTSPLAFAPLIPLYLVHRRPRDRLLDSETPILANPD